MLTAIGATGSAGSGPNVNAEMAKIQRQIAGVQEQMKEKQGLLLSTPEGEPRKALQQQLQSLASQIAMLQAQLNALRAAGALQSATAQIGGTGKTSDDNAAKADKPRVNASGVPIGSVLNVEA